MCVNIIVFCIILLGSEFIGQTIYYIKTGPSVFDGSWLWDIASTPLSTLEDCGRLVRFMELTNFNEMAPHDELKYDGTEYVLALPGDSYIAYASILSGSIGSKNMTSGLYDFKWYDVANGNTVYQKNVFVNEGDWKWTKPLTIGEELAVYIKRRSRNN